ncbi:hypothetical protein CC2G_015004 [Coprinopsis cinerea AmutBmut pab1-1]|nr:hypothetical protein CC2G_014580 [Coprinopsis cinerea AmutBmut pab1-1]KAG2007303.1 hypothetical protein CC2G_015004 [Coprinopsis cinerea AmutBmut pab1-1]
MIHTQRTSEWCPSPALFQPNNQSMHFVTGRRSLERTPTDETTMGSVYDQSASSKETMSQINASPLSLPLTNRFSSMKAIWIGKFLWIFNESLKTNCGLSFIL